MTTLDPKRLVHKLRYGPYVNSITKEAADMIDALSALPPQPVEVTEVESIVTRLLDMEQVADPGMRREAALTLTTVFAHLRHASRPSGDGIQAGRAEVIEDAARWRALMSSQKMHWMGSAGFEHKLRPGAPKGSNKLEKPRRSSKAR